MKHPSFGAAYILAAAAALFLTSQALPAQAQETNIVIGRTIPFTSKVLGRDVEILVSLPEGYAAGTSRYPVLYVLTGFLTFDYEHGAVKILTRMQAMPGTIIVGVPDFVDGYVPTPFEERGEGPTPADTSLRFLREELIPFIDQGYRTNRFRILYGHSVGGLFTIFAMFNAPDLFSAYIAGSPWFQRNDGYWLKNIERLAKVRDLEGKRLFMTVGKGEAEVTTSTYKGLEAWFDAASLPGLTRRSSWVDGDHGTMLGRNTYDGLQFIFADWKISADLLETADVGRIEAALAERTARWGAYGFSGADIIPEARINGVGYRLLRQGAKAEAVRILAYNSKRFPSSFNALDSLAEAYLASGDRESAVKYYRLAVAGNPGDTEYAKRILANSRAKLKELGAEEK